jgi:hypothetical protein
MEDPNIEWTVNHERRKMEQAALSTDANKRKFIHDVQNGMGDLIKDEPNKPQKKIKWYHKLFKLFTND